MRKILEAYRDVYVNEEVIESDNHEEMMLDIAIQLGLIGQRLIMGKSREGDGEKLLQIGRLIEKEYKTGHNQTGV